MGISRFYSIALGREKNFSARTDGLISAGDTTPDVSLYSLLYADTAGDLTIANFDNGQEGQIVSIINLGNGLISFSTQMKCANSSSLSTNDSAVFVNHNSSWYELSKANDEVIYTSELGADNAAPNCKGSKVMIINNSGATVLAGISGGYTGQILTVVNVKSNVTLSHNALLLNADTGGIGFVLTVSASVDLININGTKWVAKRYAFTP